jgi:hypothetical protein
MIEIIKNDCRWCKHLKREEDGAWGESMYFWYECESTSYHNLRSFPFAATKCKKFEQSEYYTKKTYSYDGKRYNFGVL